MVRIVKSPGFHCTDAFGGEEYRGVPTPFTSTSPSFECRSSKTGRRDIPYGDLTIISPTILSEKPLNFRKTLECHPSGRVLLKRTERFF